MDNIFEYPIDTSYILRKKNALIKTMRKNSQLRNIRIAVLGGSSTQDIVKLLDLFLLSIGYKAEFYESDFNRYYETIMYSKEVFEFKPDIIYIHTNIRNLKWKPDLGSKEVEIQSGVKSELALLTKMVTKIKSELKSTIIVNNIEYPQVRPLGNYDGVYRAGIIRYIRAMNSAIAEYVDAESDLLLLDINYISSIVGLDTWFDEKLWYSFSYGMSLEAQVYMAKNLSSIIRAVQGEASKCIAVDLDNTMWDGVIGDDGVEGIHIGDGTPSGTAHLDFQKYLKSLYNRGITLTICSKNELDIAKQGLSHKGMFLKEDEFALIKANWLSKDKNVKEIANNLNIGVSSIVFVDDNPVEREIVRSNVAPIEVPDIGNDPSKYQLYLDRNGYFEAVDISNDDMQRNQYYRSNLKRETEEKMYGDYSEYLRSLEMTSQISGFKETDMDRIRQLTNKTNQFNMTTIRMNQTEIDAYRTSGNKLGLSARLEDKFGDNGLVSIIAGSFHDDVFVIDLWLMSCRVFKRDLEYLVFAELVRRLREYGIETVRGIYRPTERNRIIQTLYEELGFQKTYSSEVQVEYEVSLNAIEVKNIDYIKLSGDE